MKLETTRVEVCRESTWHIARTCCVLGEVGRAGLRTQTDCGSKSVSAIDQLCDCARTGLPKPQFLCVQLRISNPNCMDCVV